MLTYVIDILLRKLNNAVKTPFSVAVFVVVGTLLINAWAVDDEIGGKRERGVLGGPDTAFASERENGIFGEPALFDPGVALPDADASLKGPGIHEEASVFPASLEDTSRTGGAFGGAGSVVRYTVRRGDTLSHIAENFGISVQTIAAANPEVRARALQIGQELSILPVSGVLYEVREGETVEAIAARFGLSPAQIRDVNRGVNLAGALSGDTVLVIPGARARTGQSFSSLPSLPAGYFAEPSQGYNWGTLHDENAVDIANSCGTPITAAQEGLVVDAAASGWNNGYGHFLLIEHPNSAKTRYAHLDTILVSLGDYVEKEQNVGVMGNTGNVHGPTGCHLHFEVHGAQNPFAK